MKDAAIDFETKGIESRPAYPPEPTSCGIWTGGRFKWLCWGHPIQNNCSKADARRTLKKFWKEYNCIFHNAAFDIDVGDKKLGLGIPNSYQDTQFLAFLNDPRDKSLALKELAVKYFNMNPDEQDELKEWIITNYMEPNGLRKTSEWGAYISEAPGNLVGKYCKGDVVRTMKMYRKFRPTVMERGMMDAYDRELALMRTKLRMERHGVATAQNRLKRDIPKFQKARDDASNYIIKSLKITPEFEAECPKGFFNINSSNQLADAMENAGLVDEWVMTAPSKSFPDGQRSTSIDNLKEVVKNKRFVQTMAMLSTLDTYLNTFLMPWREIGQNNNGFIFPTFNQVRTYGGHGDTKGKGTKTGRPSVSNPNFNNIPANAEESKNKDTLLALAKYLKKYGVDFIGLRDYIAPTPGQWLIGRDYQQQELRVLAHFEDGDMLNSYIENPSLDIHDAVRVMLKDSIGLNLPRKAVKTIAFAIVYGLGLDALAEKLETNYNEAKRIKTAYLNTLPGIADLSKGLKGLEAANAPFYTIGGRQYFTEEPSYVDGRRRTWAYKNMNYLVQGTSADITKQAMLNFEQMDPAGQLILQVYDEIVVDTPDPKHDMPLLREALESSFADELDLAMPTDGEWSKQSWARMRPFREPKIARR